MSEYTKIGIALLTYIVITVALYTLYYIYKKARYNKDLKQKKRLYRRMQGVLSYAEFVAIASWSDY